MTYDELLIQADDEGLKVREKPIKGNDGRIRGCCVAIRKDIKTTKEKSCVLAEEMGHYHTTSGDILDQSDTMKQKQEYRARLHGYNLKVGLIGLIKAYEAGFHSLYEMAEFLDVTEEYMRNVIECYRAKYGVCTSIDNYVICFEPCLAVARVDRIQRMI